jgi:methyl-accepting chemotaxis protein
MQTKLIVIFLVIKMLPLILFSLIAWNQFVHLGDILRSIAVDDSATALNNSAVKNIERLSTDTAKRVAEFLYARDADIRFIASLEATEANFSNFVNHARKNLVVKRRWELAADNQAWQETNPPTPLGRAGVSTNSENNDMDGFHAIPPLTLEYRSSPIYDEITFIDRNGKELVKVVASDSPKTNYPLDPAKKDVSRRENTYVKAEDYFEELKDLKPGEVYVSDVIGAYVGTNFIGMYTPGNVSKAASDRGYDISYSPEEQAYAGTENPNGKRFEGIVRWATPMADSDGKVIGYVTLALNHDHIMEFVDHITPLDERYVSLPSAFEGNYAFIWDYQCRSICHPRHSSIVGFDPETGDPQIPWVESSIYTAWKESGVKSWAEYSKKVPAFSGQSREKRPAPELIRAGLVGLDGRFLNNAPQCTGWMDLTKDGGSGSFFILWSGLYKLNTAATIPYYTGQYAPSSANSNSRRGFGFVAIGSGLDYFSRPARETQDKLVASMDANMSSTMVQLVVTALVLMVLVIIIAVLVAWNISRPIKVMANHMSRLATGEIGNQDVPENDLKRFDEIGLLARSLQNLTEARREELGIANILANGDYTQSLTLRSENDLLGKSLNAMINITKTAISQVSLAVGKMGMGASSVSNASASLSHGVETSEDVIKKISDTLDTVDRQAHDNAERASNASKLAEDSRNAAKRGYDSVTELTNAMTEIQQAGKKIATVAKLIDDIAFQTNLLALNAAVEAARAGRNGKGFSVVADEVRNLSARSARAAQETGEMVGAMQKLMEKGTELAEHSDREFHEIVDTTGQVAQVFGNITSASNSQSTATSQIVQSLGQISQVIQENSRNAKQMSASARSLTKQADELQRMVAHFHLGSESKPREIDFSYNNS